MSRPGTRSEKPIGGEWRWVATTQTMHDRTVLPTWGVKVAETNQWIAKAHALGPTLEQQAEAHANVGLFAASKVMAVLLEEATTVWAQQFDAPAHQDCSVSGADLMVWFTEWRHRARQTLDAAGVP